MADGSSQAAIATADWHLTRTGDWRVGTTTCARASLIMEARDGSSSGVRNREAEQNFERQKDEDLGSGKWWWWWGQW